MTYDASHVEHISNLITSDGWDIMKAWLETKVTFHKSQLENCELDKVEHHRSMLKAFSAVINQPQHIIDEVTEQSVEQHSK